MIIGSTTKGEIAARLFDIKCMKLGYGVSVPLSELRYDRVVERDGKLYRVQVKYCDSMSSCADNAYQLSLRTWRNKKQISSGYSSAEIDALVVYLPINERLYWFPPEVFVGRKGLQLRVAPPKIKTTFLNISQYEFGVLA